MKPTAAVLLCACLCATGAQAAEAIRITATRKTAEAHKSQEQDLWRGQSRATKKDIYYRFDLQPLTPDAAQYVTVQWMILVEGLTGNILPRGKGESTVELTLGKEVSVETTPVHLSGREWTGGPNPGTVEEHVAGYAVRILDADGKLLAEKQDPSSISQYVQWEPPQPPAKRRLFPRLQRSNAPPYPFDPDEDPDRR